MGGGEGMRKITTGKPGEGLIITINCDGLTEREIDKIQMASFIAYLALNSPEFISFCLNYEWEEIISKGWWPFRKVRTTSGHGFRMTEDSRQAVCEKIMKGRERLTKEEDHEADIFLKVDRRNRRGVLGYTYKNTKWQWVYSWFLGQASIDEIAGNLIHEWLHKLGYIHEKRYSVLRRHTVPYAIGYFVRDYLNKGKS